MGYSIEIEPSARHILEQRLKVDPRALFRRPQAAFILFLFGDATVSPDWQDEFLSEETLSSLDNATGASIDYYILAKSARVPVSERYFDPSINITRITLPLDTDAYSESLIKTELKKAAGSRAARGDFSHDTRTRFLTVDNRHVQQWLDHFNATAPCALIFDGLLTPSIRPVVFPLDGNIRERLAILTDAVSNFRRHSHFNEYVGRLSQYAELLAEIERLRIRLGTLSKDQKETLSERLEDVIRESESLRRLPDRPSLVRLIQNAIGLGANEPEEQGPAPVSPDNTIAMISREPLEVFGTAPAANSAPPTPGRLGNIFISYATRDLVDVLPRIDVLFAYNGGIHSIFLDRISLVAGDNWKETIRHKIELCDVFFLFWSSNAHASEHVTFEWKTAFQHQKRIVPIPLQRLEEAPPPDPLRTIHFSRLLDLFFRFQ